MFMKKTICVALIAVMVLGVFPIHALADEIHFDTAEDYLNSGINWKVAKSITENQVTACKIPAAGFSQWFKIYVPSDDQTIEWTVSNANNQPFDGKICVEVDSSANVERSGGRCYYYWTIYNPATKTQKLTDAGYYYIHIYGDDITTELLLQYTLIESYGGRNNSTRNKAILLTENGQESFTLEDSKDEAWYKIIVPEDGQEIRLTVNNVNSVSQNPIGIQFCDSNGKLLDWWTYSYTTAISHKFSTNKAGDYYVRAYCNGYSTFDGAYGPITSPLTLEYSLVRETTTITEEPLESNQDDASFTDQSWYENDPEPSLENFTKSRSYSDRLFTDNNTWGREYLIQAYEYNIISGKSDAKIDPSGILTGGEAVTIAARIHAVYKYGLMADDKLSAYSGVAGAWYAPYVAYCKDEGLIGSEFDGLLSAPVTRAQMVGAWRNILSDDDIREKNNVNSLPDVDASVPFCDSIFMFYRAGIISGTDTAGTFKPYNQITRQECATIFIKMIIPALRSSFTLTPSTQIQVDALEITKTALPMVSVGIDYSLVVDSAGNLWAWGDNLVGQLGDGTEQTRLAPVIVMDNVAYAATNTPFSAPWWHSDHSVAIKTDGSLWVWGGNSGGQLGNGKTKESISTPIKIMNNVASVSAGAMHTLALKTDGSVWAWGQSNRGALGDGTTADSATPIKVMDDVVAISAGAWHSMAIKKDGSLWAWGSNTRGELGNGTTTDSYSPIKIMDGVKSVSAGFDFTMAIKNDGSLWSWGMNYYGQLGEADLYTRSTPGKVMDGVYAVSAGCWHTMAIKTDGSLWGWGQGYNGQIGNNTKDEKCAPVKIMDEVSSVSAGQYHTLAIKEDGSLWAWGWNAEGWLGDGTKTDRLTPVKITLEK